MNRIWLICTKTEWQKNKMEFHGHQVTLLVAHAVCGHPYILYQTGLHGNVYEVCPKSIQLYWISRELAMWPWCNLAASQRRPYSASMQSFFCGASQSAVRCHWLNLCTVWPSHSQWPSKHISFITTMCLAHSTALMQVFLAKHHITKVCQPPYSQDLAPWDSWLFPQLKLPLKWRRYMNAMVTWYTSSVNGVSLPTD
jgi:hypothetical protein